MKGTYAVFSALIVPATLTVACKDSAHRERELLRAFCNQTLTGVTEAALQDRVAKRGLELQEELNATSDHWEAHRGYESPAFVLTMRRVHIFSRLAPKIGTCDATIDTRGNVDTIELLLAE